MYAVASTEKITEMSSFAKEHGWWSGDYNSYTNVYSLYSSTEKASSSLIAHEQQDTNKLIRNIDLDVFSGYLRDFLESNNIQYNPDKLSENAKSRKSQNIEILKTIFENKYGVSVEDSKLGQLIFNSAYFIDDDEFDTNQDYYYFTFVDEDNIKVSMCNYSIDGIAKGIINKSMEEICYNESESAETIIVKEFDLDEINGYSILPLNDKQVEVKYKSRRRKIIRIKR